MPDVSIEQIWESKQTYFRLKGVLHLLQKSVIKIRRLDTNEMLGPDGWKKQDLANDVGQTLDKGDLLLEIDSKLINHIDPGRAIELRVEELGLTAEILPGEIFPYAKTKAVNRPVHIFQRSAGPRGPQPPVAPVIVPEPPPEPKPPLASASTASTQPTRPETTVPPPPGSNGAATDHASQLTAKLDTGSNGSAQQGGEPGSNGGASNPAPEPAASTQPESPPTVQTDPQPSSQAAANKVATGRTWVSVTTALVLGGVIGYFGKFIVEEYIQGRSDVSPGQIAQLEAAAFAPLNPTLRQFQDKSPAGVTPDTVASRTSPDRARAFYNYGVQKAQDNNQAEAVYWYKQSLATCDVNALAYLGDALVFGEGRLSSDARTGFQLLRLATALGHDDAKNQLVRLLTLERIPGSRKQMAIDYQ